MKIARFPNGESFFFERTETHDDKVLFYRSPIGLVHAKTIEEFQKATIEDANSNNGGPQNGAHA